MDDGNGRPPIALAGNAPIVQAEVDLGLREITLRQPGNDGAFAFGHGKAVEPLGVHQSAIAGEGFKQRRCGRFAVRGDDAHDGQIETLREVEIAAVVAGHRHDRAGAVAHQHVVRNPHRNLAVIHRIDAKAAGEHARLVLVGFLPLHQVLLGDAVAIRLHGRALCFGGERVYQRMFGCQHHIGSAEQRVRPGGEHADGALAFSA